MVTIVPMIITMMFTQTVISHTYLKDFVAQVDQVKVKCCFFHAFRWVDEWHHFQWYEEGSRHPVSFIWQFKHGRCRRWGRWFLGSCKVSPAQSTTPLLSQSLSSLFSKSFSATLSGTWSPSPLFVGTPVGTSPCHLPCCNNKMKQFSHD